MMTSAGTNGRIDDARGLMRISAGAPQHLRGGNVKVTEMDGAAWITREGDGHDYVIEQGQEISLSGGGMIVIEALTPLATVRIERMSS
jgi:hypothetical protein